MTIPDFITMQAAYEMEPWGEERADARAATIAFCAGGGKFKMDDILKMINPWAADAFTPPTPAEVRNKVDLFNAAMGGKR